MLLGVHTFAQDLLGVRSSNYSGLHGAALNHGSIVDGRLKWDINIFSIGVNLENNYVYIPKDSLKFFGINNAVDMINDKGYKDKVNSDEKNLRFSQFLMGPGVMFHATRKHAFAFVAQERMGISVSNVAPEAAKYAYEGLGYDSLHYANTLAFYDMSGAKMNIMAWLEYNFSYATILKETDKYTLKGGITLKYLLGHTAAYFNNTSLNYNVLDDSTALFVKGSADYGRVSYDIYKDFSRDNLYNGKGIGGDIGFIWELHKDPSQYTGMMDGEKYIDPSTHQYAAKFGLSLLDVGKIKFTDNANTFHLEADNSVYPRWDLDHFDNNVDFDRSISQYFYGDSLASLRDDHFSMALPTALSVQADVNIYKSFYTSAVGTFHMKSSGPGIERADVIAITPRIERPWFEVALPISYYMYNSSISRIGLALRLGNFLWFGSDKLGSMMGLSDMYGADVYAALKFGIGWNSLKDKDKDQVSDKVDVCPEVPGLWKFKGCPDKDGDGVEDKLDKCPDIAGPIALEGCPDTDLDGIVDIKDSCPADSGLVEFNGCPDRDGDKIIDKNDSCPDVAGPIEFNGCPDTDKDSIIDKKDDCPDVPGLPQFNGCPDTDGDGVIDSKDRCPNERGTIELNGCPPAVQKAETKAPEPVEIKVSEEVQKVINKVFSNLQFETGKSVIRTSSYESLNTLVTLLRDHPEFRLSIAGHTDNVGNSAKNLKLSKDRAAAVKAYLTKGGVEAVRIISNGFGSTKPIAPNSTPEGRAQNRRVEFKIVE